MKVFLLFGCLVTGPFDETVSHFFWQCSGAYCYKQGLGCYQEKWGKIMDCVERKGEELLNDFDCMEDNE